MRHISIRKIRSLIIILFVIIVCMLTFSALFGNDSYSEENNFVDTFENSKKLKESIENEIAEDDFTKSMNKDTNDNDLDEIDKGNVGAFDPDENENLVDNDNNFDDNDDNIDNDNNFDDNENNIDNDNNIDDNVDGNNNNIDDDDVDKDDAGDYNMDNIGDNDMDDAGDNNIDDAEDVDKVYDVDGKEKEEEDIGDNNMDDLGNVDDAADDDKNDKENADDVYADNDDNNIDNNDINADDIGDNNDDDGDNENNIDNDNNLDDDATKDDSNNMKDADANEDDDVDVVYDVDGKDKDEEDIGDNNMDDLGNVDDDADDDKNDKENADDVYADNDDNNVDNNDINADAVDENNDDNDDDKKNEKKDDKNIDNVDADADADDDADVVYDVDGKDKDEEDIGDNNMDDLGNVDDDADDDKNDKENADDVYADNDDNNVDNNDINADAVDENNDDDNDEKRNNINKNDKVVEFKLYHRGANYRDEDDPEGKNCPVAWKWVDSKEESDIIALNVLDNLGEINRIEDYDYDKEHQKLLLMSMESVSNYKAMQTKKDYFDYTIDYRLDSDVPIPYTYDFFDFKKPALPTNEKGKDGRGIAAVFISNCSAKNKRLEFLKELMKHTKIDSYGMCAHNKDPYEEDTDNSSWDTKMNTIRKYKFTLAFENSDDRDYVTEKFFQPLEAGSVPVFYGTSNIADFAPEHSYINANDFSNAKELAKYLEYLDEHDEEYEEYLAWKKKDDLGDNLNHLIEIRKLNSICSLLQRIKGLWKNPYLEEWDRKDVPKEERACRLC